MIMLCTFLKWLLENRPQFGPCRHKRYRSRQWFDCDGVPWTCFECKDCDYYDRGHVYGPLKGQPGSEDWEGQKDVS